MKIFIQFAVLSLFFSFPCLAYSQQSKNINPATGITSWQINAHGVNFSLTQILPDQLRAFYVNRNFTVEQTESYASSCVYMTILRNDNAPGTIHFTQSNWSIIANKKTHLLVSVESWIQQLKDKKVNNPALLAFRFAQFPPEQEYEPGGDWNQGMLSVGLPAGSIFDVIVRWDINGKPYETKLEKVQCAE